MRGGDEKWPSRDIVRTLCDLAHRNGIKGDGVELIVVISLVALFLVAAAVTVAAEDRRAARRHALRRQARLAEMGEADPLTPHQRAYP